jgi:SRSO17 transposase
MGTAGRIENAQIRVFLAFRSRYDTAFLDTMPYLPKDWPDEPERCEQAGIPSGTAFATKPRLTREMQEREFVA